MQSPIFIVGAPRSGTTLLSSMLSAHPLIAISPETAFMSHWYAIRHWYGDLNVPKRFNAFWADYTTQGRFAHVGVDASQVLKKIRQADHVDLRTVFTATMEEYASKMCKARWGEKSPGHQHHLRTLLEWYPDAKVLFLVRDPRAVYASMLRVPWGNKNILWQTGVWKRSVQVLENHKPDKRIRAVKYEDLVEDPQGELRRLCEFLSEDFSEDMLDNRSELSSPISEAIGTGWTREYLKSAIDRPITTESVEKWRGQLTRFQVSVIEQTLGKTMRRYDYSECGGDFGRSQALYRHLALEPAYVTNKVIWLLDLAIRNTIRRSVPFATMRLIRRVGSGVFTERPGHGPKG